MIRFDILTLFPEMFPPVLESSILGRAAKNKLLSFRYTNIRDFSTDKHNKVDDYPYGGGCGMVMQPAPIYDAYRSVSENDAEKPLTVFLSPRGKVFNQEVAKEMARHEHIVLICGHYEGIDQRVIDEIGDLELSVGDFVLTGGELGAMIVCDAVSRLVPGVLAEEQSYTGESHYSGLLEYPQYTRPVEFLGNKVPEILLSGKQTEIDSWRAEQALCRTELSRPDLFEKIDGAAPKAVRKAAAEIKAPFSLLSFGAGDERDLYYKSRRKLYRKLQKSGLYPKEEMTVFSDINKLNSYLSNSALPAVILCPESILKDVKSERPLCVIADSEDKNSLYPYRLNKDKDGQDLCREIAVFLSIVRTAEKYAKKK